MISLIKLVRAYDKHGADRGVVRRAARLRRAAGVRVDHVVELGDFQGAVADKGVIDRVPLGFLYVFHPRIMIGDRIDAQADDLAVAFVKLRFESGHVTQFRGADRGEILGV